MPATLVTLSSGRSKRQDTSGQPRSRARNSAIVFSAGSRLIGPRNSAALVEPLYPSQPWRS